MERALAYVGVGKDEHNKMSAQDKIDEFKAHFGSHPLVIANIWYDLCHTSIEEARLTKTEKSERGFKRFMIANHYLWTYPRNVKQVKRRFGICLRYLEGDELWHWPMKIAALKEKKIVWSKDLLSHETEIIAISVDAVNFRTWEKKHPTLNKDPKFYDHKHNSCGFKYEIAVRIYEPEIAWFNGPKRCGMNDKTVFKEGLKEKLESTPGKRGVSDGGYEFGLLCLPNSKDPQELKKFKSRARCRHETLNGRLVHFGILQYTFRHGMKRHEVAFTAVAVIVQYQMDNGFPIFDV